MLIGVTGFMSAGKTTLCEALIRQYDYEYLNLDDFRRNLLQTNQDYQKELCAAIPQLKKPLTSKQLNDIIYVQPKMMAKYKSILYKYVKEEFNKLRQMSKDVLIEWALLIQDKLAQYMDKVIIVKRPIENILLSFNPKTSDLSYDKYFTRLQLQYKSAIQNSKCPVTYIGINSNSYKQAHKFIQSKDLSQGSRAYFEDVNTYELYSQAEDKQGAISTFLRNTMSLESVLDAGCGSGKFLNCLESISDTYTGIDISQPQLDNAATKISKKTSRLVQGNLDCLPFFNNCFDVTVSAWVLGTIQDDLLRKQVVNELKRVTKNAIILIENAPLGQYEYVRAHNISGSTEKYNAWLISQGFKIIKRIKTQFEFDSLEQAQTVFRTIYSDSSWKRVTSPKIEHFVDIYYLPIEKQEE